MFVFETHLAVLDPEKKVWTLFSLLNMLSPKVWKVSHWLSKEKKGIVNQNNLGGNRTTTTKQKLPYRFCFSTKLKWMSLHIYVPGSKLPILGMVIQPLVGNPYNGYINPYYWVDDHPLLYGNNGSLDPGTYVFQSRCRSGQAGHLVTWYETLAQHLHLFQNVFLF